MAILSLQSKQIPQLPLGRHYVFTSQLLRLFPGRICEGSEHRQESQAKFTDSKPRNRWKLVFFFWG